MLTAIVAMFLQIPLYIPDNSDIDVSFWRVTDGRKVWYEWMVETFLSRVDATASEDDASNSTRVRLGTSDLCSSKKNGCLMH